MRGSPNPPLNGKGVGWSLRIVAADHDPAWCRFYREVLARLGHQVCLAGTGRQLVGQCRLLRPDLVITEAEMPDLDGTAAIEQLCREQPVPIILVPGCHDPERVGRALGQPHVLACLFKPIKEADLGPAIAVAVSRFRRFQSLTKETADLRQALEDRKLIERAKGMVMKFAALDETEAYRRLQEMASVQNRKLVEVAQTILTAGEAFQRREQPQGVKPNGRRARNTQRRQETGLSRTSAVGKKVLPLPGPVPQGGQESG
jgi:response regulator NasT